MLQQYIKQFLASKRLKAKNTQEFYEKGLRFYSEAYPEWPLTDTSITNFLVDVMDRGCKPATVHAYFRAIRTFCNWLHKRKLIDLNPVELVDAPRLPMLLPRAPEQAAIVQLFESLSDLTDWFVVRDCAILSLALDTGLRIGEITYLELLELRLTERQIIVKESKSKRQRVVMFDRVTQQNLELWLAHRHNLRSESGRVFVGLNRGKIMGMTHWGVRQILERRLEKAGLSHFRFHDLRHAYAVYFLRNGGNLMDVKKQLGHANIAVTNVYTELVDDGRKERHEAHSPVANLTKK